MGHATSVTAAARCCQEDQLPQYPVEFDTDCPCLPVGGHEAVIAHPLTCHSTSDRGVETGFVQSVHHRSGRNWKCCKGDLDEREAISAPAQDLESLSYIPARFDESQTIDVERSHARYSKIVVHSMRTRMQRRSKTWEDWVRAAITGRSVTLLHGLAQTNDQENRSFEKVAAWYHLDRALTKFFLLPERGGDMSPIVIMLDNIQVICPASDFMLLLDQADALLDDSEKSRAVVLQYVSEDSERKRICFLEESDTAKENFVQALTALWLEKRNDHSMWF